MISLAPDPTLPGAVPELICAWVMVGLGEGGREELRHKLVMIEGVGGDDLNLSLPVSSCLNFKKGETGFSLANLADCVSVELLPGGVGEEGREVGLVKLPLFIDVFSKLVSISLFLESSSLINFFVLQLSGS